MARAGRIKRTIAQIARVWVNCRRQLHTPDAGARLTQRPLQVNDLEDLCDLIEGETGAARAQSVRVTVSEVAQKIRANGCAGEELRIDTVFVEA